jgi:hypothetical protein
LASQTIDTVASEVPDLSDAGPRFSLCRCQHDEDYSR